MLPIDGKALEAKYDLVKLSVHSSTQISSRAAAILSNLDGSAADDGDKAKLVVLTANARVANKLISIVEIAKRELHGRSLPCFQYNALHSVMMDVERQKKSDARNEDASDDAFETMPGAQAQPALSATKKRNVPVMSIYLSKIPVKELKTEYGEQT